MPARQRPIQKFATAVSRCSTEATVYGKCIVGDYNAIHKDKCINEFLKLKDCVLAEELAKVLSQMKLILQGTPDIDSTPEQVYQLVTGLIEEDLLLLLAQTLHRLPFESRKDTQVIFSYVFRFRPPTASPKTDPVALSYVVNNKPQILLELCRGYDHKESATPAGTVLREVLKNEAAAAIILYDDGEEPGSSLKGVTAIDRERPQSGNGVFWRFFDWIDKSSFEVAADAFTTFRELLTKHKELVPRYLSINFELFFDKYNNILVQSNSYVTKRQSIKLLGEILLDRSNYNVMTAYVDRGEHLKICMNLLRSDRKMVQYEGFHVFKVFVANPHKSIAVQKILLMNREKLLNFLSHFLEDRTDDEQFIDEREFLIKQIRNMPPNPVPPTRQLAV
ncbi:Conidiophore development protein hymA [Daldinia childiae]|uniref:Conidiophore development protein hymA n=1 Tax=Daldinia childiae TaxID=326645 RepID=UPI001446BBE1|nr:Conidiophore development protein hymA [Daldinia childiae]KAF3067501.1 Conidiophore development protein hymA [Daldinia childiae]